MKILAVSLNGRLAARSWRIDLQRTHTYGSLSEAEPYVDREHRHTPCSATFPRAMLAFGKDFYPMRNEKPSILFSSTSRSTGMIEPLRWRHNELFTPAQME